MSSNTEFKTPAVGEWYVARPSVNAEGGISSDVYSVNCIYMKQGIGGNGIPARIVNKKNLSRLSRVKFWFNEWMEQNKKSFRLGSHTITARAKTIKIVRANDNTVSAKRYFLFGTFPSLASRRYIFFRSELERLYTPNATHPGPSAG